MIKTKTVYVMECDSCGDPLGDDENDEVWYPTEADVREGAVFWDWFRTADGYDLCEDCSSGDPDDEVNDQDPRDGGTQ